MSNIQKTKKNTNSKLCLIKVEKTTKDATLLFEILKKRTPSISHKSLPTFQEHKNFVLNHPYRAWFIVKNNSDHIGTVYILKNNSIGVNLIKEKKTATPWVIKEILSKYKPLKEIKSVRAAEFDFHVSPRNADFVSILEKMGARLAQSTYVFDN